MKAVRSSGDLLDIYKYDDNTIDRRIEELVEALEKDPENPFAWMYLGSYLQLAHQPEAAALVTEEALRTLGGAKWLKGGQARELEIVAGLNLASYRSSLESYRDALAVLESLGPPEELNAFHRTSYYWQKVQALLGLGETESAREVLAAAREIRSEELAKQSGQQWDYPRYFGARREAAMDYLEARILIEEGDFDRAEKLLKEAVAAKAQGGDPELWDARYALVNVLFAAGRPDEALRELECLQGPAEPRSKDVKCERPKLPKRQFYRPENLDFNRGNILFSRGDFRGAIRSYHAAIDRVCRHHEDFVDDVDELATKGSGLSVWKEAYRLVNAEKNRYFADAFNNCGNSYLELNRKDQQPVEIEAFLERGLCSLGASRNGSTASCNVAAGWESLLAAAQGSFERALQGSVESVVVRTNLAEALWLLGKRQESLRMLAEVLAVRPTYRAAMDVLRSRLEELEEPRLKARAYSVLLNVLSYHGPSYYLRDRYGDILEDARDELQASRGGMEADRAAARLYALGLEDEAAAEEEEFFRAAQARYPQELWPLVGLARVRFRGDDPPLENIEKLLKSGKAIVGGLSKEEQRDPWVYPDVRDFFFLNGVLEAEHSRTAAAEELISKALAIDPLWAPARLYLSTLQEQDDGLRPNRKDP